MTGWLVAAIFFVTSVVLFLRYRGEQARRKQRGLFAPWPIPTIGIDELDPVFATGPFGPTLDTEVTFVGRASLVVPGGTSDAESWILAVLAKRASRLFEFGTCTGKTAYLWSRNAPPGAEILTLTLAPSQRDSYAPAPGDAEEDSRYAVAESAFSEFLYTGTDAAGAIVQLHGDSKALDESPWADSADLVFVDGSHARSFVESDSRKAMRIVRSGGLVLWHDYAGPAHAPGVFHALNVLAKSIELRHVRGTTLVAWRRPQ
jgi:hypothetical protein